MFFILACNVPHASLRPLKCYHRKINIGQGPLSDRHAHCGAAVIKKAKPKTKAGQSARDAVRAAAAQRRREKASAKPDSPPWDNVDRQGREAAAREIGESDEDESDAEDVDEDFAERARVRCCPYVVLNPKSRGEHSNTLAHLPLSPPSVVAVESCALLRLHGLGSSDKAIAALRQGNLSGVCWLWP